MNGMKKTLARLATSVLLTSVALLHTTQGSSCRETVNTDLPELFSNPACILLSVIQFGLGLGIGYSASKAVRYTIAIIGFLTIGILLNVWYFGGLEGLVQKIGLTVDADRLVLAASMLISLLAFVSILPMIVGIAVGAVVAKL